MSINFKNKWKAIGITVLVVALPVALLIKSPSFNTSLPGLLGGQKSSGNSFAIQKWETKNGLRVFFSEAPGLPIAGLSLIFDAGSARDGHKGGVAGLTSQLLSSGTDKLSADDIAQAFDEVGSGFSASASRDSTEISLQSLTEEPTLSKSLATFTAIIHAPSFKESELERNRNNVLTSLASNQKLPDWIVERKFYDAIYKDHPYAHSPQGTPETIKAMTRADLQQFYSQYYVNKNGILAIVGNLSRDQAEKIAEQISGALPEGKRAEPLPKVEKLSARVRTQVDFNSAQTQIMIGSPGMSRKDDDYFPLYVGNFVLGGSGFSSILFDQIRERRGLAYTVYSYFMPLRERGPFLINLQSASAHAAEALQLTEKNLADYVNDGPTDEQLRMAKKEITGGFPLKIDSNSNKLAYVGVIGFYDLPLDYLDRFNAKIESVSKRDIKKAFADRINDGGLAVITVGQPMATPVKHEG